MKNGKAVQKTEDKLNWYAKGNRVYSEAVIVKGARISFPSLAEPKPGKEQKDGTTSKPRYEVTLILDADDKETQKLDRRLTSRAKSMVSLFNKSRPKSMPSLSMDDVDSVMGDGNNSGKDGKATDLDKYPMYEDKKLLFITNTSQPDYIDDDGENIEGAAFKAGMICNAVVVPHFGSTGLSFRMETLQLAEDDGVRFGGAKPDYKGLLVADVDPEDEDEAETEEEDDTDTDTDSGDDNDDADSDDDDGEEEEKEEAPVKTAAKRGRPSLAEVAAQRAAENVKKSKAGGKGLNAAKDLL